MGHFPYLDLTWIACTMEITPKNNTSQHVQPAELGQEEKLGADENLCHATVGNFRCFWHPDDGKVMGS